MGWITKHIKSGFTSLTEAMKSPRRREGMLEAAIRLHRDQRGDDRCFEDDYRLYSALGEPIPDEACKLCDPQVMLENCKRFCQSRHDPSKPYYSPQREVERYARAVTTLMVELEKSGYRFAVPKELHDTIENARMIAKHGN